MFTVYEGDEILTQYGDKRKAVNYAKMCARAGNSNVYVLNESTGEVISLPRA